MGSGEKWIFNPYLSEFEIILSDVKYGILLERMQ